MTSTISVRPCDARILVAITVHFNAARLEYLAETMRSLSEFPVAAMHVILVANTVHDDELGLLRRLCDETLPGKNASIRCYEYLAHPHYLTWRHRELVASEFGDGSKGCYTHFIYLEDDIRLSFANFNYFIEYRENSRAAGLLPSFLRIEYNRSLNGFVNSDNRPSPNGKCGNGRPWACVTRTSPHRSSVATWCPSQRPPAWH